MQKFFNASALTIILLCVSALTSSYAQESSESNPNLASSVPTSESQYGSHSHIYRPNEVVNFPRNLDAMRETGLDWMRTDFLWDLVEPEQGTWDFAQYDEIVEEACKRGVNILGILGYSPTSGERAWKIPERWAEYVAQTVGRYRGKVDYWEVWNEENIGSFWENPDPKNYVDFLKITAETARKVNPDVKILFGGTAGVPFDFIEECLKLGASKYFDVMNIHPYRPSVTGGAQIKRFQFDLQKTSDLTAKYGERKPLWITEMGWADVAARTSWGREFLAVVLNKIGEKNGEEPPKKVAFLRDVKRMDVLAGVAEAQLKFCLPEGVDANYLLLDDLKTLNPKTTPVLVAPPREVFPTPYADAFYKYVEEGGTLVFLYGFPCYYKMEEDENGYLALAVGENAAQDVREKLRVDIRAWWFDEEVPKEAAKTEPSEEFANCFSKVDKELKADRFLGTRFLKEGDELIPILMGSSEDGSFSEPVAGMWRFNGDWKGNIAVYTLYDLDFGVATAYESAANLSRAYLTALASRVDRFFMYQFQARETTDYDREDHFGLYHADLTPKLTREAVFALAKARPRGAAKIAQTEKDGILYWSWKRPDGKTGWAISSPDGSVEGKFVFEGEIDAAFDFVGAPIDVKATRTLTEDVLYVVGPTAASFEIEAN